MPELSFIIIFLLVIFLFITIFYIFSSKKDKSKDKELQMLYMQLQQFENRMSDTIKNIDHKLTSSEREMKRVVENQFENSKDLLSDISEKMHISERETRKAVENQFQDAGKLIKDITSELMNVKTEITSVKEGNKQVLGITEQLQNLEKVLKHQKQRGNLGEASLELILSNILPPGAYKMQYEFNDKTKVDAIIITKDGFIPVDAKFSLDNYQRIVSETNELQKQEYEKLFRNDLKNRIDETSKYIKTEEGTLPFAFMFIPAEGIYYDLLINEVGSVKVNSRSLIDYAYNEKKVIIVSPTTFYAYLQSVLYGFKAFKIEESAKGIQKKVEELGRHLLAYEDYMRKIGISLGTTVNNYNSAYKELKKVDKDITKITGENFGINPELIEKPDLQE
jgi:DNA recombination protein RmuC